MNLLFHVPSTTPPSFLRGRAGWGWTRSKVLAGARGDRSVSTLRERGPWGAGAGSYTQTLLSAQPGFLQSRVSGHFCGRTTPSPVRGAHLPPAHSSCAYPGASQWELPITTPGNPRWSFHFFCDLEMQLLPQPAKPSATHPHSSSSFSPGLGNSWV